MRIVIYLVPDFQIGDLKQKVEQTKGANFKADSLKFIWGLVLMSFHVIANPCLPSVISKIQWLINSAVFLKCDLLTVPVLQGKSGIRMMPHWKVKIITGIQVNLEASLS